MNLYVNSLGGLREISDDPPIQGPPKPEKPKHRATREEIRLRREKIARMLGVDGLTPDKIYEQLHGTFHFLTMKVVYDDIEHLKRHSKDYIALQYLPDFGWVFQRAVLTLEEVGREAIRRYRDGETETQMSESPKGTITKVIHREGSAEWLNLAAKSAIAQVNLGKTGPVTLSVQQILDENERLKRELLGRKSTLVTRPQS